MISSDVKRVRRPLGVLATELAVVFLGVLIALGVDSWWSQRQDRNRAEQYVDALQTDMAANRDALTRSIDAVDQHLTQVDSFLELLWSDEAAPPGSEHMPLRSFEATVTTGTIDALVATGDIDLLTSTALRSVILAERSRIADIKSGMSTIGQMLRDAQLLRLRAMEELRAREALPPGRLPVLSLRRSPDMIAGYAAHRTALRNDRRAMEALRLSTERIDQAIRDSR